MIETKVKKEMKEIRNILMKCQNIKISKLPDASK